MSRVALISRHIVFLKASMPIYGIILVEGELIYDVIIADPSVTVSELVEKYNDWNPIDLEDYFISPGIIEINARREWESYKHYTKSALSGGVTFIVEENNLHCQGVQDSNLYCDVGSFATVSKSSEVLDHCSGIFGYKAYLYPPCSSIKAVNDLPSLVQVVESTHLPLLLDVINPNKRLYNEVSPCHYLALEERLTSFKVPNSWGLVGAFTDEVDDSQDEEEEEVELIKPKRTRSNLLENFSIVNSPNSSKKQLPLREKLADENARRLSRLGAFSISEPLHISIPKVKSYPNIYTDLDQRIRVSEQSIEHLSKVEQSTYSQSGNTNFNFPWERCTFNSLEIIPDFSDNSSEASPPKTPQSARSRHLELFRPSQLSIKSKVEETGDDIDRMYMLFLANYPSQWEVSGVNALIDALENSMCRVHVTCLSSASAINRVRKAQETFNITCEVAASTLYFTDVDIAKGDTRFKNSPPIRNGSNCNLLWDLLKMKAIHSLSSQHRGIHPSFKLNVDGSFRRALSGLNTLGFTLQQVWTKLRIPLSSNERLEHYIVRLAKWLSFAPAKVLGIDKSRGSIERGMMADLVIWNPHEQIKVQKTLSQFKETCLLLGVDLFGCIHKVMLRGRFVLSNGRYTRHGRRVFKTDFSKGSGKLF